MANVTSVTNHFLTAQEGFTTTTSGSVASGATTVGLNSVTGYSNGDNVAFVIDPTDTDKKQVFTGVIDTSGVQVTGVKWTEGTNQTHAAGATVVDYTTATHQAALVKGLEVSLDQDGTLKAGAVDNSAAIADGVVTNAKIDWSTVGLAGGTLEPTSSTVVVSGLGFTPREVNFTFEPSLSTTAIYQATGFSINTSNGSDVHRASAIFAAGTSTSFRRNSSKIYSVLLSNATNNIVQGHVSSWDSDGFTVTFATTGGGADTFSWVARE